MKLALILIQILFTAVTFAAGTNSKSNGAHRWGFNSRRSSSFPLWPRPVVPYTLDPNLNENLRRVLLGAMQEISSRSCWTFKPKWNNDIGNLNIRKVMGSCHAQAGTPGNIVLHIGPECLRRPQGALRLISKALGTSLNNVRSFTSPNGPLCQRMG